MNRAIGVGVIVLGALILVGEITFAWAVPFLGLILLTIGVLQFSAVIEGGSLLAGAFLFLGVVLLLGMFGFPAVFARVVDVAAGTALVILGILRFT